jgi:hypothetical protein
MLREGIKLGGCEVLPGILLSFGDFLLLVGTKAKLKPELA